MPQAFSILERIDVGETLLRLLPLLRLFLLSVSSNGSTWVKPLALRVANAAPMPFSILERIDVGETLKVFPAAPS